MLFPRIFRVALPKTFTSTRNFSATTPLVTKNRIYNNIRHTSELETLLLLSSSSNKSLLTLWTTSWCSTCTTVSPLLKSMIEQEGIGEAEGGVGYAQVEMDAVSLGEVDLRGRYMINSIPTLLAFSRGEAQNETKVTRLEDFKSRDFMKKWIESEARRGGAGGAGGSLFDSLGSLFGR
ncbi:hypothetical protein EJ08DRAFT_648013 [Tothia fuscella]|uniref:Thioredoxin domain-containing protein n=1 Tax=Tothia fuscella TaxID=1048955 RepID=A0A9P4NWB6_9PEZI|nr:hypothetical protein EJ08DRAFT_648013 [Tothia fuscella]